MSTHDGEILPAEPEATHSIGSGGTRAWGLALWIPVVALLVALIVRIPFDMDEFLPYHPIFCMHPSQQLNVYEGACGSYPTTFFGVDFQRAFNYVGASTAWLMAPLLTLWTSWWIHSLVGMAALIAAGVGMVRSLRLSWGWLPVTLLWFPVAYATVHDTGPIRISLLVLVWTPVALASFLRSRSRAVQVAIGAAVTLGWMLALESKPFFAFLIPGVIAWALGAQVCTGLTGSLRTRWRSALVLFAIAGSACLALLLVMRVGDQSYLAYLMGFPSPNKPLVSLGTGITFMADWPFTAHRVINLYPNVDANFLAPLQSPLNALPWGPERGGILALGLTLSAILAVFVLYTWAAVRVWRRRGARFVWATAGAAGVLFLGALASAGGSSHHYVYAQVPLLALCLVAFGTLDRGLLKGGLILTAVTALSLAAVLAVPTKPSVSPDIDVVMEKALALADASTVINCASWGCYHQYAFLNIDSVPIVFAESPEQQQSLLAASALEGRTVMHVCFQCTADDLDGVYPSTRAELVMTTPSGWTLFDIVEESDE